MGKPLEVLIIFFDDFYDVGLGCASTIALALILPGLSNKVRSPRVWSVDNAVFIYTCIAVQSNILAFNRCKFSVWRTSVNY